MPKFYMTDKEIRQDYLGAKDRKHQVEILADRNLVSKTQMRNKLIELGLIGGEPTPEKVLGGRPKPIREIDEAEVRELIEKDVPDEQIAAHFGVGFSTFRDWRRSKQIFRYPAKKKDRETIETKEEKAVEVPVVDLKQMEEKPMQEKETSVKVAEDADGMTVSELSELLAKLDKLGEAGRVRVGCNAIRGVLVHMRFDGKGDAPTDMSVELEV